MSLASWRIGDVDAAEIKLRAALPGIKLEREDYGLGLVAFWNVPNGSGMIVFRPALPSRGDDPKRAFRADLDHVIAELALDAPQDPHRNNGTIATE